MKNNFTLPIFLLLYTNFVFSQDEKLLHGKIVVEDATPKGVLILNLSNEKETISDSLGHFSILAKPEDLVVFSASHLDYMRKIIEEEDFESGV